MSERRSPRGLDLNTYLPVNAHFSTQSLSATTISQPQSKQGARLQESSASPVISVEESFQSVEPDEHEQDENDLIDRELDDAFSEMLGEDVGSDEDGDPNVLEEEDYEYLFGGDDSDSAALDTTSSMATDTLPSASGPQPPRPSIQRSHDAPGAVPPSQRSPVTSPKRKRQCTNDCEDDGDSELRPQQRRRTSSVVTPEPSLVSSGASSGRDRPVATTDAPTIGPVSGRGPQKKVPLASSATTTRVRRKRAPKPGPPSGGSATNGYNPAFYPRGYKPPLWLTQTQTTPLAPRATTSSKTMVFASNKDTATASAPGKVSTSSQKAPSDSAAQETPIAPPVVPAQVAHYTPYGYPVLAMQPEYPVLTMQPEYPALAMQPEYPLVVGVGFPNAYPNCLSAPPSPAPPSKTKKTRKRKPKAPTAPKEKKPRKPRGEGKKAQRKKKNQEQSTNDNAQASTSGSGSSSTSAPIQTPNPTPSTTANFDVSMVCPFLLERLPERQPLGPTYQICPWCAIWTASWPRLRAHLEKECTGEKLEIDPRELSADLHVAWCIVRGINGASQPPKWYDENGKVLRERPGQA